MVTTQGNDKTPDACLTFKTFGEHTSVPIAVRKAVAHVSSKSVLDKSLTVLELGIANETIPKDISSKLRLVLPAGWPVWPWEYPSGLAPAGWPVNLRRGLSTPLGKQGGRGAAKCRHG